MNRKIIDDFIDKVKIINLNNNEIPIVISIPHSGEYLTKKMFNNLEDVVLSNMDWYLDKLYSFLTDLGFTIIINNVSRYVIDVNREIKSSKPNDSYKQNYIYTRTTFDKKMYKKQPTEEEIKARIKDFYIPYHNALLKAVEEKSKQFNKIFLIDLHSFGMQISSDIILGNDKGNSASKEIFLEMKKLFEEENFIVNENKPFSGGYITKFYGKELNNCESIQIELNYKTYIDKREFGEEEFPAINKELFKSTQEKMKRIFSKLKKLVKNKKSAM